MSSNLKNGMKSQGFCLELSQKGGTGRITHDSVLNHKLDIVRFIFHETTEHRKFAG